MKFNILCFAVPLGLWLAPQSAAAQSPAATKAASSQLFDDAEALSEKGEVAQACAKYAESERLDPQLGTLLHLGDCYDKLGRTASAWASFKDAVEIAAQRHDEREAPARIRLAELEPKLSKLTIEVASGAPPGLEISQDRVAIGAASLGSSFPIDPGEHIVVARANGFEEWSYTINVAAGTSSVRVMVPQLRLKPTAPVTSTAPGSALAPATLAPGALRQSGPSPSVGDTGGSQRVLGYVVGGAGVVGIGIGTVFALAMKSKVSDRNDANACSNTSTCTYADKTHIDQLTSDARTYATVANVGFIAGGVALIGGVALVVTGLPKDNRTGMSMQVVPLIGSDSVGLGAGGRW